MPQRALKKSEYLSDEQIARDREYTKMRRREGKTPAGIRYRNKQKTSGSLHFHASEDGKKIFISTNKTIRPIEKLVLAFMQKAGATIYQLVVPNTNKPRGMGAMFTNQQGDWSAFLEMKPIPEPCVRCDGSGKIQKPDVTWHEHITCLACHGSGKAVEK